MWGKHIFQCFCIPSRNFRCNMHLQYAFSHHRVSLGAPYRGTFSKSHFYKCVWYLYIRLIPGKQNQINSRTGIQIKKSFFQEHCVFYCSFLPWRSDKGQRWTTELGRLERLLSTAMRSSALTVSLDYLNVKCHTRGCTEDSFSLLNVRLSGWCTSSLTANLPQPKITLKS